MQATGAWIERAALFEKELSDDDPAARADAIQHLARTHDLKAQTVRRTVAALRAARSHARRAELRLAAVKSSIKAIEALELLERRNPTLYAEIRRGVLLGDVSAQAVTGLAEQRPRRGLKLDEWATFAVAFCEVAFANFESISGPRTQSSVGAFLRVDLEVELPDGRRGAVFLSPTCPHALERRFFADVARAAFAALAFFDAVRLGIGSNEEKALFLTLDKAARDGGEKRLVVLDRLIAFDLRRM